MRLQLALNVPDLERAIDFYRRLFGVEVHKREPGYANFVVDQPALKLVLFESDSTNQLNHLGVEVFDDAEIETAAARLEANGLTSERQAGEVCCYARQNKAVTYSPEGTMWEFYRVLEDSPTFFAEPQTETSCCT